MDAGSRGRSSGRRAALDAWSGTGQADYCGRRVGQAPEGGEGLEHDEVAGGRRRAGGVCRKHPCDMRLLQQLRSGLHLPDCRRSRVHRLRRTHPALVQAERRRTHRRRREPGPQGHRNHRVARGSTRCAPSGTCRGGDERWVRAQVRPRAPQRSQHTSGTTVCAAG